MIEIVTQKETLGVEEFLLKHDRAVILAYSETERELLILVQYNTSGFYQLVSLSANGDVFELSEDGPEEAINHALKPKCGYRVFAFTNQVDAAKFIGSVKLC